MTASEPVTVSTIGFNVPCRRFLLTANVTRDRRLPIVDEFVLRTLKLCEPVPIRRLAAFFGFSDAETEIVVGDLVGRGLLSVEGDDISLHPSAHEHFRGSDDGAPHIVEVDSWVDRLWFDLVSRNMMIPERTRPLSNLIDVQSNQMARELPAAFARKAFEENFAEYLRKVRRVRNPDRFGLYSVSEVQAERFGSVVLKGREDLVFDPEPKLRPQLLDFEFEDLARYRPLTNAMSDAYRLLNRPEPSVAALDEFKRLIADSTVEKALRTTGTFDLSGWLSENSRSPVRERRTLIGASYLPRNMDLFMGLLDAKFREATPAPGPREIRILWLRPGGSLWGTSPDLQDSIARMRGILKAAYPHASTRVTLVVPQVARRDNPRRFERPFDEGFVAPAAYMSPGVEILHIEGHGALVLVAVSFGHGVSASVGYALVDSEGLDRVHKVIDWENIRKRAQQLWTTKRSTGDEELADAKPAAVEDDP